MRCELVKETFFTAEHVIISETDEDFSFKICRCVCTSKNSQNFVAFVKDDSDRSFHIGRDGHRYHFDIFNNYNKAEWCGWLLDLAMEAGMAFPRMTETAMDTDSHA